MGILEMRTIGWRNRLIASATFELSLEGYTEKEKEISIECILKMATVYQKGHFGVLSFNDGSITHILKAQMREERK